MVSRHALTIDSLARHSCKPLFEGISASASQIPRGARQGLRRFLAGTPSFFLFVHRQNYSDSLKVSRYHGRLEHIPGQVNSTLNLRIITLNLTIFYSFPDEVVPCSDMAGEIIAVGDEAGRQWKKGDRVCANFAADHIAGDITPEIQKTAHGGAIHGVLTQYKAFSPHVRL